MNITNELIDFKLKLVDVSYVQVSGINELVKEELIIFKKEFFESFPHADEKTENGLVFTTEFGKEILPHVWELKFFAYDVDVDDEDED